MAKVVIDPGRISPELLYNSEATAELLGMSVNSVRYLAWSGKLKPTRIGRKLFFRGDELLRYLGIEEEPPSEGEE